MTKKVLLMTIMLLLSIVTYSQDTFKKTLEAISTDLCSKMAEKGKKKIVVLFVTDTNKAQTTLGKYMADVVSYYVVNNQNGFSVFDRENLSGIAEAKKLIAEGYIDANNAKQLGKILSVEAIVVGNYTVLSSTLSLTLKALDVNDGFVIAQSLNDLPIDRDAATLLGISPLDGSQNKLSNRGFDNRPLNSNESYNNPETVNKECQTKNTGDFCFQNDTNYKLKVGLITTTGDNLDFSCTLQPGQIQCFYGLPTGSAKYIISSGNLSNATPKITYYSLRDDSANNSQKEYKANGQILVEKCKSKTFVIN